MYGLGAKPPGLVILGTNISRLGTKVCPNEIIFYAHREGEKYNHIFFIKHLFDQVEMEMEMVKILLP